MYVFVFSYALISINRVMIKLVHAKDSETNNNHIYSFSRTRMLLYVDDNAVMRSTL
jgi:hypothetical protein